MHKSVSSHGNALGLYLNHLDPAFDFAAWTDLQNPDLFAVRDGRGRRLTL